MRNIDTFADVLFGDTNIELVSVRISTTQSYIKVLLAHCGRKAYINNNKTHMDYEILYMSQNDYILRITWASDVYYEILRDVKSYIIHFIKKNSFRNKKVTCF